MQKISVKLIAKLILLISLGLQLWSCSHPGKIPLTESSHQAYLSENLYAEFKKEIPNFPVAHSAGQKSDEKELRRWQKVRTGEECKRAASEVVVTLQSFYGPPYGELTIAQVQTLQPFFDQIRSEGGPYIGQFKKAYTRQRPYEYIHDLMPCVGKESSFAYPSGHATLAVLYALVLKDLFPNQESNLQQRSYQIALDRVIAGVHHSSDIEAGKKLGQLIYNEFKKSKAYEEDVQKYKNLLL